jgi:hypothetical protein
MKWRLTKDQLPADKTALFLMIKHKNDLYDNYYGLNFGTYKLADHAFYISVNDPVIKYPENEVLYWTYISEIPVPKNWKDNL